MDQNDIQIIIECQAGRLEKFGELYEKYVKKIYDFVYFKTHHKETAEDLTSQVFMKALKSIGSFKTDEGHFSAWIYKIARNTIIDHYRALKPESNLEDAFSLSSNEDVPRDADMKLRLEKVMEHMKVLTAEQREVLMLRVWGGYSYKEIAEVTGKKENNCKVIFSRAIIRLREEMPSVMAVLLLEIINNIK